MPDPFSQRFHFAAVKNWNVRNLLFRWNIHDRLFRGSSSLDSLSFCISDLRIRRRIRAQIRSLENILQSYSLNVFGLISLGYFFFFFFFFRQWEFCRKSSILLVNGILTKNRTRFFIVSRIESDQFFRINVNVCYREKKIVLQVFERKNETRRFKNFSYRR